MTCFNPIKAFIVDENGNDRKFHFASVDTPYIIYHHQKIEKHLLLPCGKCDGCKVDRSRDWANRMMLELKYHKKACFVTLTYNEENVPKIYLPDENGEAQEILTLRKKDFQAFMKRLREQLEPLKIRFFACGEYGPKTLRPHYHAIIFGWNDEDRVPYDADENGFMQYRSPMIEKVWTNTKTKESMGFSLIADVNWNTCAYVARYCVKKREPIRNIYYQTLPEFEPEFNLMSRRPGIGRQYYEDNKEQVYINQEIFLSNLNGGMKVPPPKYFDRLYEHDNPAHMEEIKERRREIAEKEIEKKLKDNDLTLGEYLREQETYFKSRIKKLKRKV